MRHSTSKRRPRANGAKAASIYPSIGIQQRTRPKQDKLAAFAEDLLAFAKNAVTADLLFPDDAQAILFWRNQLARSAKALKDIFEARNALGPDAPSDSDGELWLNCALSAAFVIGSRLSDSPIKARLIRDSAARATQARKASSSLTDEVIVSVGLPVWTRHPRRSHHWVAGEIFDDVNQKLKEQHLQTLKIDAVRKRVKRLRTDERASG
jgi:hypothetical protein